MFFFSKPKKEEPKKEELIVDNPVLGKMEYVYNWWSFDRIDVFMFGKKYSVKYYAAAGENKGSPNSEQEDAFKKMLSEREKWQIDVEQAVIREIKLAPSLEYKDVIKVTGIHLSHDGGYGISMEISEEYLDVVDLDELDITPDQCFGVSVFPDLYVIKSHDDFDNIYLYLG
ncbi:MAG: hypothetical protein HDT42_08585 [Ruminococcaceae bacterium]|nr:hypothetical protein [Oscillospiraceae bacterium]